MKACFKCNRWLALSEFYKHPAMGDGYLGKCKSCTRVDVRANREKRRDYYMEYDRERSKTPERLAGILASQERHPVRLKARRLVHSAIAGGRLVRLPCEVCGNPKSEGHHPDYDKPLEVMWLCRRHHSLQHRKEAA
jgi:hypothetical protein